MHQDSASASDDMTVNSCQDLPPVSVMTPVAPVGAHQPRSPSLDSAFFSFATGQSNGKGAGYNLLREYREDTQRIAISQYGQACCTGHISYLEADGRLPCIFYQLIWLIEATWMLHDELPGQRMRPVYQFVG